MASGVSGERSAPERRRRPSWGDLRRARATGSRGVRLGVRQSGAGSRRGSGAHAGIWPRAARTATGGFVVVRLSGPKRSDEEHAGSGGQGRLADLQAATVDQVAQRVCPKLPFPWALNDNSTTVPRRSRRRTGTCSGSSNPDFGEAQSSFTGVSTAGFCSATWPRVRNDGDDHRRRAADLGVATLNALTEFA